MDYKARFYSPVLGRFIQPDTIIPGATNPQSWNRFGYVMNNPIRFTDPSGHACVDGTSYCVDPVTRKKSGSLTRYSHDTWGSDDPNIKKQDELFSLMFQGSGEDGAWTFDDWADYYENRSALWANPSSWKNPDDEVGWELFTLHVTRLAQHYSADQSGRDQFVEDFALVFAGLSGTRYWASTAWGAMDGSGEYNYLNYTNEGLNGMYLDSLHDAENASHHYAGLFFGGYHAQYIPAGTINFLRDGDWWNDEYNPGDLILGYVAVNDGATFRNPYLRLSPTVIGEWLTSLSSP